MTRPDLLDTEAFRDWLTRTFSWRPKLEDAIDVTFSELPGGGWCAQTVGGMERWGGNLSVTCDTREAARLVMEGALRARIASHHGKVE